MVCFLMCALLSATAQPAPDSKPAVVPFEILATRHLAVQVKVNGKGPYRVIFDTGAPVTLLNSKLAKEAGVLGEKVRPTLFGMAGEQTVKLLELGDLKAENMKVIVMDHPALTAVSKVLGPVDGIVGFPFFSRYRMTLDYQAQQFTFVPTDYQPADMMANLTMMLLTTNAKPPKKNMATPAVWGFVIDKQAKDEDAGVTIASVWADSPASAAGLKVGDRLLVLDGVWTDSVEDCYRAAKGVKAGKSAQAKYLRDGKEVITTIRPVEGL